MTAGALDGVRVIDLSRVLAGPYCTMLLADYGAEVIKIERPGSGDDTRRWGPPWVAGESTYFLSTNRNKRSVTLNLKTASGRSILERLVSRSDVLVENFRPGTLDRLGIGYEALREINPGLVYCAITGYGQTGPYRDRPGYDFMIQAQGGLMSITGPRDGEPYKAGVAIVDISAGLYAASAILAALHHRQRTGEGQLIDVALLDSQLAWLANVAQGYLSTGEAPRRYGNAHPNIVPYEVLPTADGSLALAIGNDAQFARFCRVADCSDLLEDPRFLTNAGRVTHRGVLLDRLRQVFRARTTDAWIEDLIAADIPASPVLDLPTVLADPQVKARGTVQTVEHPKAGPLPMIATPARFSKTPASIRRAPPQLGADTDAVLRESLGLDAAALASLRAKGAI